MLAETSFTSLNSIQDVFHLINNDPFLEIARTNLITFLLVA